MYDVQRKQRGFTLIEMIVALFIAALVLSVVFVVFDSHNHQSIAEQRAQELQANNRSSLFFLTRALKNAGTGVPIQAGVFPANQANFGVTNDANDVTRWDNPPIFADPNDRIKNGTDAMLILSDDLRCGGLDSTDPKRLDREHYIMPELPGPIVDQNSGAFKFYVCQDAPNCFSNVASGDLLMIFGVNGGFLVEAENSTDVNVAGAPCNGKPYTEVNAKHVQEFNFAAKPDGLSSGPGTTATGVDTQAYRVTSAYLYYVSGDNRFVRVPIRATPSMADIQEIAHDVEDLQFQYNLANTNGATTPPLDTCLGSGEAGCPFVDWDVGSVEHQSQFIRHFRYQVVFASDLVQVGDASGAPKAAFEGQGRPFEVFDHTAADANFPINLTADNRKRRRHQTQILSRNLNI